MLAILINKTTGKLTGIQRAVLKFFFEKFQRTFASSELGKECSPIEKPSHKKRMVQILEKDPD
jgi:hypothetical protein